MVGGMVPPIAIPYVAADSLRVIPSCMIGAGVAGSVVGMLLLGLLKKKVQK